LEQEFGGALFDRGPPVRLSPLGEVVKPHFKAILSEIDKIHRLRVIVSEGTAHSGNGQDAQAKPPGSDVQVNASGESISGRRGCLAERRYVNAICWSARLSRWQL
jgi:hypothetical protein